MNRYGMNKYGMCKYTLNFKDNNVILDLTINGS